jgi:hypothetical protein
MRTKAITGVIWFLSAVSAPGASTHAQEGCPQPFLRPDVQAAAAAIVQKMTAINTRWTPAAMKAYLSNGLAGTRFGRLSRDNIYRITGGERGNDNLALCFPTFRIALTRIGQNERLENERRLAEQQRAEAERNKPANVLLRSYTQYIYLRKCQIDKQGYVSVNASLEELDRAETAAGNIEKKMMDSDPTIDKEALWQAASKANSNVEIDSDRCQVTLRLLENTYLALRVSGRK